MKLRVVTAGTKKHGSTEKVEFVHLEPGLESIQANTHVIQNADVVVLADLGSGVFNLPRSPIRILRLLAGLGLLSPEPCPEAPIDVDAIRDLISSVTVKGVLDESLKLVEFLKRIEIPKPTTPEQFAVACIVHWQASPDPVASESIDFNVDSDGETYRLARERLIRNCAALVSELFKAGQGLDPQELFILAGLQISEFSKRVLYRMFSQVPHKVMRTPAGTGVVVSDTPLQPVFETLVEDLKIANKREPGIFPDYELEDTMIGNALGSAWSFRALTDRAGKGIGLEIQSGNLNAALIEVWQSSVTPDMLPEVVLSALVEDRTGEELLPTPSEGLTLTGDYKVLKKGKRQWKIIVDGLEVWAKAGQFEKLLVFVAAKCLPGENGGVAYTDQSLNGDSLKKLKIPWPASRDKAAQDVRDLVSKERLRTDSLEMKHELTWRADQIDFSPLLALTNSDWSALSDPMKAVLNLLREHTG